MEYELMERPTLFSLVTICHTERSRFSKNLFLQTTSLTNSTPTQQTQLLLNELNSCSTNSTPAQRIQLLLNELNRNNCCQNILELFAEHDRTVVRTY